MKAARFYLRFVPALAARDVAWATRPAQLLAGGRPEAGPLPLENL